MAISMPSHDSRSTTSLLRDAMQRSCDYLDSLGERPVSPRPDAIAALGRLEEPLPDAPSDPASTLALLPHVREVCEPRNTRAGLKPCATDAFLAFNSLLNNQLKAIVRLSEDRSSRAGCRKRLGSRTHEPCRGRRSLARRNIDVRHQTRRRAAEYPASLRGISRSPRRISGIPNVSRARPTRRNRSAPPP